MIKHKHHIVPRHAGGSNDPSNLKEVTVEEHAEEHRKLYEEFGRMEDYIAWIGLSGSIGKEEIINLRQSLGGKKGFERQVAMKKHPFIHQGLAPKSGAKGGIQVGKLGTSGFQTGAAARAAALIPRDKEKLSMAGKKGFKVQFEKGLHPSQTGKFTPSPEDRIRGGKKGFQKQFELGLNPFQNKEIMKRRNANPKWRNSVAKANKKKFADPEWQKAMREIQAKQHTCPHCGKIGRGSAMFRHHFDRCPVLVACGSN